MKFKHLLIQAGLLVAGAGIFGNTFAAEDMSKEAYAMLHRPDAEVVVASREALLFESPDFNSAVVWRYSWVQTLLVDSGRINLAHDGWIPVVGTHGNPAGRNLGAIPDAWIRQEDVVVGDKMKKVIGCWPIKKLTLEQGDYSATFYFTVDGNGFYLDDTAGSLPGHPSRGAVEVFMEKNIVMVADRRKNSPNRYHFVAGFNIDTRTLVLDGAPPESQELFFNKALLKCKSVPLLRK